MQQNKEEASPTYEKGSTGSGRDVIHRKVHEAGKMEPETSPPESRITGPLELIIIFIKDKLC